MNDDPFKQWTSNVPCFSAFGLASAIIAGCIEAHAHGKRFKRFPRAHVIGQIRYAINQERLIEFADVDPTFTAELQRHPGGTTFFVALVADGIRTTLALTESSGSEIQPSLFRAEEQVRQLSFFDGTGPCVYTVVYGDCDRETGRPKFLGLHALDGQGDFLDGYLDLLQAYNNGIVQPPIEPQDDQDQPPRREQEEDDNEAQND